MLPSTLDKAAADPDFKRVRERIDALLASDLDALAVSSGAMTYRRKFQSAADVLSVCLRAGLGATLRDAAVATSSDLDTDISNPAILKVLRRSEQFMLQILLAQLRAHDIAAVPDLGRPVCLTDASCIPRAGKNPINDRLHVVFDASQQLPIAIQVSGTDSDGAERIQRFEYPDNALVVADRGYGRVVDLAALREQQGDRGVHALIRISPHALPLIRRARGDAPDAHLGEKTSRLAADAVIALADGLRLNVGESGEIAVHLLESKRIALGGRLLVYRRSAQDEQKERTRIKLSSRRHGRKSHSMPSTLAAARYVFLFTTLPDDELTAERLTALYRWRWRIESYFKHVKSHHGLRRSPARSPQSAGPLLIARLLVAALLTDPLPADRFPLDPIAREFSALPDAVHARMAHAEAVAN